jgi:hypothetical protein
MPPIGNSGRRFPAVLEGVLSVIVVLVTAVPGVTLEGEKLEVTSGGILVAETVTTLLKSPPIGATVMT